MILLAGSMRTGPISVGPARAECVGNFWGHFSSHNLPLGVAVDHRGISKRESSMAKWAALLGALFLLAGVFYAARSVKAAAGGPIPAAAVDDNLASTPGKEIAVFAGGCFWGTQSVFERVKGVLETTVGYSGGTKETATYDQVNSETTGHAESLRVVYDPSKITYGVLLRIFFSVAHDPTELNRQGPDVGPSYRSVIFYANEDQRRISSAYIAQLDQAHAFAKPIVTQVVPLKGFYDAEHYHQHYADLNPDNPYILVCDRPKIAALRQQFPNLFQEYKTK
jgi:peptide-methionine (S)-S-oxide reductase